MKRLTHLRYVAALALPILLAACGETASDDERSATGEVLEGTISDAMLPIDTVSSQPPLAAPVRSGSGGAAAASDEANDAASGAADEGAADGASEAPTAANAAEN